LKKQLLVGKDLPCATSVNPRPQLLGNRTFGTIVDWGLLEWWLSLERKEVAPLIIYELVMDVCGDG